MQSRLHRVWPHTASSPKCKASRRRKRISHATPSDLTAYALSADEWFGIPEVWLMQVLIFPWCSFHEEYPKSFDSGFLVVDSRQWIGCTSLNIHEGRLISTLTLWGIAFYIPWMSYSVHRQSFHDYIMISILFMRGAQVIGIIGDYVLAVRAPPASQGLINSNTANSSDDDNHNHIYIYIYIFITHTYMI